MTADYLVLRPLCFVAALVVLPWLVRRIATWVLGTSDEARTTREAALAPAVQAGAAILGFGLGSHAIDAAARPPSPLELPAQIAAGLAFAVAGAFVAGPRRWASTPARTRTMRALGIAVPSALVLVVDRRADHPGYAAAFAIACAFAAFLAVDRARVSPRRTETAFVLLLAIVPPLALWAAYAFTPIEADEVIFASPERARVRALIAPWDPAVHLALGFVESTSGRARSARMHLARAVRLGAPRAASTELEADVLAVEGRCDEARTAFRKALAFRASADLAAVLERPLRLDRYVLPPSLVRLCGTGLEPALDVRSR